MNHSDARESLQDYIDDRLDKEARRAIEHHLAQCGECAEEVAELRAIVAAAHDLPDSIPPARNLWPAIEARIAPRRHWLSQLIEAHILAPLAVAVATVIVVIVASHEPGRMSAPQDFSPALGMPAVATLDSEPLPEGADPAAIAIIAALDAEVRANDRELARMTAERQETSDRTLLDVISQNLQLVNSAVVEARTAWAANPESPQLVRLLTAAYRAKAALQGNALRTAARA